jgi:hypothetical protein
MDSGTTSSSSDSSMLAELHGVLLDASKAAKQLSSLWNASRATRLLQQKPPAAAPTGQMLEALQSANSLLLQLSLQLHAPELTPDEDLLKFELDELLHSLFVDLKLHELLAALLSWLQQRRNCLLLLQQHEAEQAAKASLHSTAGVWASCLACLTQLAALILRRCSQGSSSDADHAVSLVQQLDRKGKWASLPLGLAGNIAQRMSTFKCCRKPAALEALVFKSWTDAVHANSCTRNAHWSQAGYSQYSACCWLLHQ